MQNLPVIWPDLSMLDSAYLRKVIGHDFHEIRTLINAPGMSKQSLLIGNSWSTTWQLPHQLPLQRQSWKRNFSLIATSVTGKTAKRFYLGKKSNVLGSYGKRKSSNSRRGDNKVLHPSSFLKWKCWGRSSIHPCRVSAIARGGGKTTSYQE